MFTSRKLGRHGDWPLLAVAVLGALSLGAGCQNLECGANTLEESGKCVAQAVGQPDLECGPGTVYNATSRRCESEIFTNGGGICGPNTTLFISDAGIRTCVGSATQALDCSQPLPCPTPSGVDMVSLCGRVYELEDSSPLDDGVAANGEPYKAIELLVFDPIPFMANQSTTALAKSTPDACGRFAIPDVKRTTKGLYAVVTEDTTGADGKTPLIGDNVVMTGVATSAAGGTAVSNMRAWVFRHTTDQAWSTAAGLPSGQTFGSLGVYIPIFEGPGTATAPLPLLPWAGVTVAAVDPLSGSRTTHPDLDYYFDDASALIRRTVSTTRTTTSTNGTALYLGGGLSQYSGLGAAPTGTCWTKDLAASPPGGAFVQERIPGAQYCP